MLFLFVMAQDFSIRFYNSKAWKQCRKSFISEREAEDGGQCQICHDAPGVIVHHRIVLTAWNVNDANISLNHKNLVYVCHHCHDVVHGNVPRRAESRVTFDEFGNTIPKDSPPVSV